MCTSGDLPPREESPREAARLRAEAEAHAARLREHNGAGRETTAGPSGGKEE